MQQAQKAERLDSSTTVPETMEQLVKALGLFSATAIVMGSMIGSGIFIVSSDISRGVDSPALLIAAWAITAVMTLIGALSYGELAAMMPNAGGQYVFLREALGPMWGFLYGWTLFLVIQTGTIAAIAVAFGRFLGIFFPGVSAEHWILHLGHVPAWRAGSMMLGNMDVGFNTENLTGIAVIAAVTTINIFGVRMGALVQNIFTSTKALALIAMVAAGLIFGANPAAIAHNFGPHWTQFWRNASFSVLHPVQRGAGGSVAMVGTFTILAVVQTGSLFSADAWNNVTFAAAEVRNPRRNLPLSLGLGTGAVLFLYLLANFVFLLVLPLHGDPHGQTVFARGIQYASDDRIGTAVLEEIFHSAGAYLMAASILISTFGCANGMALAGARVFYAMSQDGLFFRSCRKLNPRFKTPVVSLLFQAVWSVFLCMSGSYAQLLDYTMFAALLFYILTIASLFVLRIRRPEAERPYRSFGYPFLPGIYILLATWICFVLLRYKPQYTWPGLCIVLLGIPVYFLWSGARRPSGRSVGMAG